MSTLRRLLLITLLVLFLSPVASYAQTDEASMLEQARIHYRAKHYSFAYTWLERVLRAYPATSRREEVLSMLTKAYASTGRDDKAAETLHTLLKEYPKAGQTLDPDLVKLAGGAEVVASEVKAAEAKAAKAMADKAKSDAEKAAAAKAAEAAAAAAAEKAAAAKAATARAAEAKAAEAKAAEAKAAEAKAAEEKAAEAARVEAFLRKLAEEKAARMASAARVAAKQSEAVATEAPAAEEKDPEAAAKEAEAKAAQAKAAEARAAEAKAAEAKAAEAKDAERREAEARIAEQKVFARLKAAEQRNAEERAAESAAEKAAEQRAAELKAAELKAAELEAGSALQPPPAEPALPSAAVVGLPLVPAAPGMPADLPAQARDAGASMVPAPAAAPAGSLTENVTAGKPESSVEGVTYTLEIGEYVTPQAMEEAKRKIKKAGLEPVVEQGAKRKGPMIRLSAGDYPTLEAAKKQLNKLHEAKVDGFFLLGGDKRYHVYVGSYADEKSAAAEGSRLAALGIKSSMKRVVVPVSTFKLTAGSFPTRAAAMAMAEELEKQGVHSVPVERALPGKLP